MSVTYTVSPRKRSHFFTPPWRKNPIHIIAKFGRKKMGVKSEFTVLLFLESRGKIMITKILVLISIKNPPYVF